MSNSKVTIVVSRVKAKIQMVCGAILIGFGCIGCIGVLIDRDIGAFVVGIIFLVLPGCLLMRKAIITNKLLRSFKTYVVCLSLDKTGSISGLAAAVGLPESKVIEQLNLMIKRNYFVEAYVDRDRNCVVIENNRAVAANPKVEYITISCENCGGNSRVELGKTGTCDYCGREF